MHDLRAIFSFRGRTVYQVVAGVWIVLIYLSVRMTERAFTIEEIRSAGDSPAAEFRVGAVNAGDKEYERRTRSKSPEACLLNDRVFYNPKLLVSQEFMDKMNPLHKFPKVGPGINNYSKYYDDKPVYSPHKFSYMLNPACLCDGEDLLFIVYIHTAPKYRSRRNLIRKTWGNPKYHSDKPLFKVLFAVGYTPDDDDLQRDLIEEFKEHGDLLQEDYYEAYRNLTYKGVGALRWIDRYCNKPKYVLKTDDDTFVNMYNYIRYLRSLESIGPQTNQIFCAVWLGMDVKREGKWGVDRRIYNESDYPTYCSGCSFTFTMDVARAIHRVSYHVPFFWVDDAYISGFLPRRIGNITHKNIGSTYEINSDKFMEQFMGGKWWGYMICSDVHRFEEVEIVWHWVVKHNIEKTGIRVPRFIQISV